MSAADLCCWWRIYMENDVCCDWAGIYEKIFLVKLVIRSNVVSKYEISFCLRVPQESFYLLLIGEFSHDWLSILSLLLFFSKQFQIYFHFGIIKDYNFMKDGNGSQCPAFEAHWQKNLWSFNKQIQAFKYGPVRIRLCCIRRYSKADVDNVRDEIHRKNSQAYWKTNKIRICREICRKDGESSYKNREGTLGDNGEIKKLEEK